MAAIEIQQTDSATASDAVTLGALTGEIALALWAADAPDAERYNWLLSDELIYVDVIVPDDAHVATCQVLWD